MTDQQLDHLLTTNKLSFLDPSVNTFKFSDERSSGEVKYSNALTAENIKEIFPHVEFFGQIIAGKGLYFAVDNASSPNVYFGYGSGVDGYKHFQDVVTNSCTNGFLPKVWGQVVFADKNAHEIYEKRGKEFFINMIIYDSQITTEERLSHANTIFSKCSPDIVADRVTIDSGEPDIRKRPHIVRDRQGIFVNETNP